MDAAVYKDCKSLVKTPRCSEFPLCSPRPPRFPRIAFDPLRLRAVASVRGAVRYQGPYAHVTDVRSH